MSKETRIEAYELLSKNPFNLNPPETFYPVSKSIEELTNIAKQIRIDIILSTYAASSGHPGGSLSSTDMLTVLFFNHLKHKPSDPKWEERDRVIFSKGHVSPLLYSLFAETGYYDRTALATFREFGSSLQGHPASKKLSAVEVSTGSLGQGLSVGVGEALAFKMDGKKQRVYVLNGDGESQEGQIWEAVMSAAHYHLDNLTVFFDYNNLEIDGWIEDVMGIAPIEDKFKSFNWHTIIIDGHDISQIDEAIKKAKSNIDRPTVIIGNTIKGKGVSFMENEADWHGKAPNREQMLKALQDIEKEEI